MIRRWIKARKQRWQTRKAEDQILCMNNATPEEIQTGLEKCKTCMYVKMPKFRMGSFMRTYNMAHAKCVRKGIKLSCDVELAHSCKGNRCFIPRDEKARVIHILKHGDPNEN